MVNGPLPGVFIDIWKNAVNDESHGTKSKPERHFPRTDKVSKIRFIDVSQMSHGLASFRLAFNLAQKVSDGIIDVQ